MKATNLIKRAGATVLAAALAASVLATGAFAADGVQDDTYVGGKTGAVTVHKLEGNEGVNNTTGLTDATATGTPVPDAGFTVYKLAMPGDDILSTSQYTGEAAAADEWVITQRVSINADGTVTVKVAQYKDAVADDPATTEIDESKPAGLDMDSEKEVTLTATAVQGGEQMTLEDGTTSWKGLEEGYYSMVETKTPDGYTGSTPSFFSIPFIYEKIPATETDPAVDSFNYDLQVYPKNSKTDKDMVDKFSTETKPVVAGTTVSWTVYAAPTNAAHLPEKPVDYDTNAEAKKEYDAMVAASTIDSLDDFYDPMGTPSKYGSFVVTDTLSDGQKATGTPKIFYSNAAGAEVAAPVGLDEAETLFTHTGTHIWTMTQAGMKYLYENIDAYTAAGITKFGFIVQSEITGKIGDTDEYFTGEITNSALAEMNRPNGEKTKDEVETKAPTVSVRLTKNNEDFTKVLPDAEFILADTPELTATTKIWNAKTSTWDVAKGTTLAANKEFALATDKNGVVSFNCLDVFWLNKDADIELKSPTADELLGFGAPEQTLYLYEVKAPVDPVTDEQYYDILNGGSLAVTVPAIDEDTYNGNNSLVANASVKKANTLTPPEIFKLPLTGGMGTTLFTVLGVAIMGCAVFFFYRSRKKNVQ